MVDSTSAAAPTSPKNLGARLISLAKTTYGTGIIHLILSVIFVQGLTYLSQLVIARLLGPMSFGIVRNIEAILSILLIIGSFGMPSLVIKLIAETRLRELHGPLLRRMLAIALLAGVTTSLASMMIAPLFLADEARLYFVALVWIIAVTACARTCINYFQGIKDFSRISYVNVAASLAAMVLLVVLVSSYGLNGWVTARYAGELLFLFGSIALVIRTLRRTGSIPNEYTYRILATAGVSISLSTVVRTVLDNSSLLAASFLGVPAEQIGYLGLATLITLVLMLLPSTVMQAALPRLAERASNLQALSLLYVHLVRLSLLITIPLSVALIIIAPYMLSLLAPAFSGAILPTQILSLAAPFRAMSILAAMTLLVLNRMEVTIVINLLVLAVSVGLYAVLIPAHGINGAALSTVAMELLSAAVYMACALMFMRRHSSRSSQPASS